MIIHVTMPKLYFSWSNLPSLSFPYGSAGKKSAYIAGHQGSIPGFGRCPGEGKGYPLQYSCLENPCAEETVKKSCLGKKLEVNLCQGIPGGSDGKESACNSGDLGSIPGSGRSPGEGKGYPLQYSCLENPMDRGAWWATVHKESDTTDFHFQSPE